MQTGQQTRKTVLNLYEVLGMYIWWISFRSKRPLAGANNRLRTVAASLKYYIHRTKEKKKKRKKARRKNETSSKRPKKRKKEKEKRTRVRTGDGIADLLSCIPRGTTCHEKTRYTWSKIRRIPFLTSDRNSYNKNFKNCNIFKN